MVKYIVNIKIKRERNDEWLLWMKDVHIRDVINTGFFISFSFNKITLRIDGLLESEDGYFEYEIIYLAKNKTDLETYTTSQSGRLQKMHSDKFKDDFKASRNTYEFQDVYELDDSLISGM